MYINGVYVDKNYNDTVTFIDLMHIFESGPIAHAIGDSFVRRSEIYSNMDILKHTLIQDIYKILSERNYIDISEEEFVNLLINGS